MTIEEEIFKTYKVNKNKLLKYGFTKDNTYKYSKKIMNTFEVQITIDTNNVIGKIYDLESQCEYTNYRVKDASGEFTSKIKEKYINILKDIRKNCFEKNYFIFEKSNNITSKIIQIYETKPEFLWKKHPGYGVFRNKKSGKWFAIIMNIDKSKIIPNKKGEIEIINLKLNDNKYLKQKGIYPAYHMNKKSWVTIILDDTLKEEKILNLINISYEYSDTKDEWIIPANPKYFDVISYIESLKIFSWKQPKNIKLNDTVYIYLGAPYSAILYKCQVIELDIYKDKNDCVMNLKLITKYNQNEYTFSKLKEYGLNSIRSPRRIPDKLSKQLNQANNI